MISNIEIKIATLENFKDIQYLNSLLFSIEFDNYDTYLDIDWPFKDGVEYYKTAITDNINYLTLVAIYNNVVIGYLIGSKVKGYKYRTPKYCAELENMMVLEKYRSFGIGTQLLEEFFKWCKQNGLTNIKVEASAQNEKAIRFYEKNNFTKHTTTLELNLDK